MVPRLSFEVRSVVLVARSHGRGFAVMGAGVVLGSIGTRVGRIAGAIIGHTGRSGGDRRRNNCNRWRLHYDLRRRRNWHIGRRGAGAGFFAGFVGGSATTENGKRSEKTQDGEGGYFVFHPTNLSIRPSIRIDEAVSHRSNRLSK
jgi:hypothetical protein